MNQFLKQLSSDQKDALIIELFSLVQILQKEVTDLESKLN